MGPLLCRHHAYRVRQQCPINRCMPFPDGTPACPDGYFCVTDGCDKCEKACNLAPPTSADATAALQLLKTWLEILRGNEGLFVLLTTQTCSSCNKASTPSAPVCVTVCMYVCVCDNVCVCDTVCDTVCARALVYSCDLVEQP
jgi:hypothetical protein